MPKRSLSQAALLAAALVLPLAAPLSQATAASCQAAVKQAVLDHGVPQSDIKSITVKPRGHGGKSASTAGTDGWVRLNSCSGHVVVTMPRLCGVSGLYTTGDCNVPGVPHSSW